MSSNKKIKSFSLENSLRELETIVATMEQGNLSLEASLKQFEQGVKLANQCQAALKAAEQKVKILSGSDKLETYQNQEE